jgi:Alpha-2,8-polysialyltransferase (POLYST)
MKKRLLAVQGPLQFIAGYIAMEWYKKMQPNVDSCETVLLMYDFLMPEDMERQFVEVITELSLLQKWENVVFINGPEMHQVMKGAYSSSIEKLQGLIGKTDFDEIYIGRDFCGDGSPLILNAYPGAARIIYGDSFGLVGNEAVCDNFDWRSPFRSVASRCKKYLTDAMNGTHQKLPFDTAVLTLPLDWSGNYLDNLPLLVPEKTFVVKTIERLSSELAELNEYVDSLMKTKEASYLFLLSNLSASGYMSQESEISLYFETVTSIAPAGSPIFLKAHPRAPANVFNVLAAKLSDLYEKIVIIDDAKLSRFPIELWVRLLQNCTIVPIFSTSSINLKYFYDKSVILPLNEASIAKYCYREKSASLSKANRAISESVNNIGGWDGNSPLWKG